MCERYLYISFGRSPQLPAATVAETLRTIIGRTLYGSA